MLISEGIDRTMQESLPGLQGFLLTSRTLGKRTYVIMFARSHPVPTVFVAGGAD